MDRMLNYIFSDLGEHTTAIRHINRYLKKQNHLNVMICGFCIFVVASETQITLKYMGQESKIAELEERLSALESNGEKG